MFYKKNYIGRILLCIWLKIKFRLEIFNKKRKRKKKDIRVTEKVSETRATFECSQCSDHVHKKEKTIFTFSFFIANLC